MIPKIIWQTEEKPYSELKPFQKNIIGTWKNLNPDWDHRYVDDKQREQDVKKYSDTLHKIYQISSGVNKSDIWRIVITYLHGGVYADMDSVCQIPLNDLIDKYYQGEDMICSKLGYQTLPGYINNSNFAAIKNSKTIKLILDDVLVKSEKILANLLEFKTIQNIGHGSPVHSLFSYNTANSKHAICYNNEYFFHSEYFKSKFDIEYGILYNNELISYSKFAKEHNLFIY
jgi:hypothetical protein